jgi:hypothetical protein
MNFGGVWEHGAEENIEENCMNNLIICTLPNIRMIKSRRMGWA